MRGANRRRRIPLNALVLALAGAATQQVTLAQTASCEAYDRNGEVVAMWEVDPAEGAVCAELFIPWVFGDDFEIGSTCAWSDRVGLGESCAVCGDRFVADGEECDDGNEDDTDGCVSCLYASCGDGFVWSGHEECDPGAKLGFCLPNCVESACGDGIIFEPAGEECDDGNDVTEPECPYGDGFCFVCGSSCTEVQQTGPHCGDGSVDVIFEDCDDGNPFACGTCSANCRNPQGPALTATGWLVVPASASLVDGETFTLQDASGMALTFEFDRNGDGLVDENHVLVSVVGTLNESAVRNACVAAINGAPGLGITASNLGVQIVALVQDLASALGNVLITETVASSGFVTFGMSGGRAGDCQEGDGCAFDDDCVSDDCNTEEGQCMAP